MKKILVLVVFLALMVEPAAAQNRFVLLIKRIALLQVYLEYLQKGYSIARDGWETVRHITKGEFDLHADYFRSLEKVNPAIKRYGTVATIVSSEARTVKAVVALRNHIRNAENFDEGEVRYLHAVLDGLLSHIEKDVELFHLVIKDGQLKMGDADRVEWIVRIAEQVGERERFVVAVTEAVEGLTKGRSRELRDARIIQRIYSPSFEMP